MNRSTTRRALLALVAVLLAAGAASAQDVRARVQGLVSDSSGGVLPGATVVLTNDGTGVSATRATRADGRFLFDFVESGTYTVRGEIAGFKAVVQKNVRVQQRGDVTVDLKLEVGGIEETVTVTDATTTVQFNTASRDLTIEQEMVKELPSSTRNPLQLAMLDPTTLQRGSTVETQPYHHRTANEMDIGGGTKYRNDVLLDGTPLTAGNKLGYTPPMDSVSEYTIQQNSVDAEFGHSAGGIAIVTMKSGTNDLKGSAYFFGRDPSLNAMSDRAVQRHNDNPYWNAGGSIGLPVQKNKLFVFAVFDAIENTQSSAGYYTLPSELERRGDFSQSYNADGSLRVIYDPLTSRIVNGVQIRDPFPGNRIPANRWDPVAAQVLGGLWMPNNAGDDLTGFNNFKSTRPSRPSTTSTSRPASTGTSPIAGRPTRASAACARTRTRATTRTATTPEAAQRHRLEAQRLEHRGRHRLHVQPLDDPERPRVVLPGRGQARVPRDDRGRAGLREPLAERLVAALRREPPAHLLALHRRREHRARSSASRTSGTSNPRATACTPGSTST